MKKQILVAEDDGPIADIIKTILEMQGYDVYTASEGQKVFRDVKNKLPSLLLLDVWMKHQDGKKICKRLKKLPETKHIPIILISATNDLEKSAKEAGADDFLTKPFEIDDLIKKVKKQVK